MFPASPNSKQLLVYQHYVRPHVFSIRCGAVIGTGREQLVIASVPAVVIDKSHSRRAAQKTNPTGPGRRRPFAGTRYDDIFGNYVGVKAGREGSHWDIIISAVSQAAG